MIGIRSLFVNAQSHEDWMSKNSPLGDLRKFDIAY